MTYAERESIFSKEVLTIKDIQGLFSVDYNTAASIIRQIKFKYDSLNIQGKIHVSDYMRYFGIPLSSRYIAKQIDEKEIDVMRAVVYATEGK